MSQFKIINLTDGTLSFAAGSTLNPGQNRPVNVITNELTRLEAAGFVKIELLPVDPAAPPDLTLDYAPDARPPDVPTFTKDDLLDLIRNDPDVKAALLEAVAPSTP